MNTQKRILTITALFLVASLLISCGKSESETTPPLRFVTVTPLPLITPPTESSPTSTAAMILTPKTKQPPTEVTVKEQTTASPTHGIVTACAPPAEWVSYTVQVNDTLGLLANRTNITVEQIKQANCLNDNLIFAGQTLHLPFIPPPPPTATLPPPPTLTVQSPATFTAIPTPTVRPTDTPRPGNPSLSIEPFSGPAGTRYTIAIREFKPGENIAISILPPGTNNALLKTSTTVDELGNSVVYFVSEEGYPPGLYTVEAHGDAGSTANGKFQINPPPSPTATMIPSLTPTVEQPSTATATPTPTVEKPDAPGPGNPRLSIEPFAGSIGTDYTISIYEFKPGENVTVSVFPLGTNDIVSSTSTVVDQTGNGAVHFVSQQGNPLGLYTVQAHGDAGSSADGNLQITE